MEFWSIICLLVVGASSLSFFFSTMTLPALISRASRWGILDLPEARKIHKNPTPRLGGVALIPSVWLGVSITLAICTHGYVADLFGSVQRTSSNVMIGLLVGCTGIFLLGLVDDFKRLSAREKIIVQALIAAITVHFLPTVTSVFGFQMPSYLVSTFAFFWLLVIPNSVNLLDGVDGLTGVLFSIYLVVLAGLAAMMGEWGWFMVLLPMGASLAAFIRMNWSPAKIFLGDSGSLFLGFFVAYTSIVFATFGSGDAGALNWSPSVSLLLASVWILDTGLAIARRYIEMLPSSQVWIRRSFMTAFRLQGLAFRNICRPDSRHIHHKLLSMGLSPKQVVYFVSFLGLSLMIGAFPLTGIRLNWASTPILLGLWASLLVAFGLASLKVISRTEVRERVEESRPDELAA